MSCKFWSSPLGKNKKSARVTVIKDKNAFVNFCTWWLMLLSQLSHMYIIYHLQTAGLVWSLHGALPFTIIRLFLECHFLNWIGFLSTFAMKLSRSQPHGSSSRLFLILGISRIQNLLSFVNISDLHLHDMEGEKQASQWMTYFSRNSWKLQALGFKKNNLFHLIPEGICLGPHY